ncbi:MAG: FAD-dependent oxidoreductase [Rhodobacteraceae bacterium]|nr:FAD-dependent oxidoreductase [Paracoccaceae bacterium]
MRTALHQLGHTTFDIAIVGGGINGAGTARSLAELGYTVLLVDKADYGSGATAASARMQHVGLRYLAPGGSMLQFLLRPGTFINAMQMASKSKHGWLNMPLEYPDLYKRISLAFPIYQSAEYTGWQVDLAFAALEMLPPRGKSVNYRRYSGTRMEQVPFFPLLRNSAALKSIAVFDDYQIDWPERICMNDVLAAAQAGAITRNYTKVKRIHHDGKVWQLHLADQEREDGVDVAAKLVINAAGAWIDEVHGAVPVVHPTKGTLIVAQLPQECQDWGLLGYSRNNQPLVAMPSRGMHFFGPTETRYDGKADDVRPLEREIRYLCEEVSYMLPGSAISRSDVEFAWSGLRPHTRHPDHPEGYRSLRIHDLGKGLFAVTGGVIASYRETVKSIADTVRRRLPPSGAARQNSEPGDPGDNVEKLTSLERIAALEQVVHMDDYLFRRTGKAWSKRMAVDEVNQTALELAAALGWTNEVRQDEVKRYREMLRARHAIKPDHH